MVIVRARAIPSLFYVTLLVSAVVAACDGSGGDALTSGPRAAEPGTPVPAEEAEATCGDKPDLPYACAGGELPCACVHQADGSAQWKCHDCPAVDCNANPNDPQCQGSTSCVNCHGLASAQNPNGIESSHPWNPLSCVVCHGGDGSKSTEEEAHVPMPKELAAPGSSRLPDREQYENRYLAMAGVERFTGGEEWLRFMNPGDLRIVDKTCAAAACHQGAGEKVRRSTMSTLVGKLDAMQEVTGARREPSLAAALGNDAHAKRLATWGALTIHDPQWDPSTSPPGSVPALEALVTVDREAQKPFGTFTEDDLLKETWNKLCGHCHLGNKGKNQQYGNFRSSGCSACHMSYDYSGRSQSGDPTIRKDEPRLPAAYDHIEYPERPHPIKHQISRVPKEQQCISCHQGSARLTLQYMGIRVDDNRDLTQAKQLDGSKINFRYATIIDNTRDPRAKFRGNTQDQLIEYEDLDGDGQDDTPPDVHYKAGMTCIDCHTAADMHGDGNIYSRQDQEVKVRCVHCHGNLEYPADPDASNNWVNALAKSTGKDSRKYLYKFDRAPLFGQTGYPYVKVPGVWLRTKSAGDWKYVPQIAWDAQWDPNAQDCIGDGRRVDPRTGGLACSPNASIAHGRYNGLNGGGGDFADGVGPRPGVEVVQGDAQGNQVRLGFSHLGARAQGPNEEHVGGVDCGTCHGTWHNMRYGAHFGLQDADANGNRFYDFDRITGDNTLGKQKNFDFTFISLLDLQLGVTAKGKVGRFAPTRLKTFLSETVLDPSRNKGVSFFKDVLGGPSEWKTYRDRVGMGNLFFNPSTKTPGWAATCLEPNGACDNDPNKTVNAALSHDQNEPHAIQTRAFSCTSCHMDASGANVDKVSAVWGWNPGGYSPQTSPYLKAIKTIRTGHGNYGTGGGYVIADDGIQHRLDYLVDESTGYPLAGNMHVRTDGNRGIPTYDGATGGPIMKPMIDKLKRVRVNDLRPANH
jgi:hypothetical protein